MCVREGGLLFRIKFPRYECCVKPPRFPAVKLGADSKPSDSGEANAEAGSVETPKEEEVEGTKEEGDGTGKKSDDEAAAAKKGTTPARTGKEEAEGENRSANQTAQSVNLAKHSAHAQCRHDFSSRESGSGARGSLCRVVLRTCRH